MHVEANLKMKVFMMWQEAKNKSGSPISLSVIYSNLLAIVTETKTYCRVSGQVQPPNISFPKSGHRGTTLCYVFEPSASRSYGYWVKYALIPPRLPVNAIIGCLVNKQSSESHLCSIPNACLHMSSRLTISLKAKSQP